MCVKIGACVFGGFFFYKLKIILYLFTLSIVL